MRCLDRKSGVSPLALSVRAETALLHCKKSLHACALYLICTVRLCGAVYDILLWNWYRVLSLLLSEQKQWCCGNYWFFAITSILITNLEEKSTPLCDFQAIILYHIQNLW